MTASLLRRLGAEFVGTALLVGIGTGAIVAARSAGGVPFALIALAWFVAVTVPVLAFASISGAHLNPLVTLALAAHGNLPRREVPGHLAAQFAGALAASAGVLAAFGTSHGLGATGVTPGALGAGFVGELGFTAALIGVVLILVRRGDGPHRTGLLLPGVVVGISTYVIGPITGSSLNPARTLGPDVWLGSFPDLWLYLSAPPLGALLALTMAFAWDRGSGTRENPQPTSK